MADTPRTILQADEIKNATNLLCTDQLNSTYPVSRIRDRRYEKRRLLTRENDLPADIDITFAQPVTIDTWLCSSGIYSNSQPNNVDIYISNDGVTWILHESIIDFFTGISKTTLARARRTTAPATSRYWRFRVKSVYNTANTYMCIDELIAYDSTYLPTPLNNTNITVPKVAGVSSWGGVTKLMDGNFNTYGWYSTGSGNSVIIFDLGQERYLGGVTNWMHTINYHATSYHIWVSNTNNGTDWEHLAESNQGTSYAGYDIKDVDFGKIVKARYIKMMPDNSRKTSYTSQNSLVRHMEMVATREPQAPFHPAHLSLIGQGDSISLSWDIADTDDNLAKDLRFDVERKLGTGAWVVIATDLREPSYRDELIPSGTYTYRVKNRNYWHKVESSYSESDEVTLPFVGGGASLLSYSF